MSSSEALFSQKDKDLIQALVYDPFLKPGFNALTDCLMWDDEDPWGISREGYEVLASLWLGRRLIHQGLKFDDHPFDPELCRRVWQQATEEIPNWPGFKRLTLSVQDRAFFEERLADVNHL